MRFEKYFFTIAENITLGEERSDVLAGQMEKAAMLSGAHAFILKLSKQYQTRMGRLFDGSEQLSGGQWQKLALARIFYKKAQLVILDEPTSALDPLGRMKVREIIQRLKNEGKTVFFSSHELGEVETVCDRVAIIHQGELKAIGRVSEIMGQHHSNLEKAFLDIVGYQP